MVLGSCALFAPGSACGQASAESAPSISFRGGQAPSPATGGIAGSLVVVARDLQQGIANGLRDDLVADGFTTAQVRREASGNYRVVLAGLPSSQEANALLAELRSAGYTPFGIDEDLGSSDLVFRVAVAEFSSRSEADQAGEALADEGFVNVDIVEDNSQFIVMLGTFNRREDAQNLLSDVSSAGFALAQVIERERVRPVTTQTNLPANVQQATRDVLSLAEKVESGEASAEEFRQLREQTQLLPQDQRQIVEQLEQSRAVSQQSQQHVFSIYRDFDRAMQAGNLEQAERALAHVRQLNPNELNLTNREQVLQAARTGQPAAPQGQAAADPARVQQIINEARQLERAGDTQQALARYREALALDPRNIEAQSQVSALSGAPASSQTTAEPDPSGGITDNKTLIYGGAGLFVLLIIVAILMRGRKAKPAPTTAASSLQSNTFDPLGGIDQTPAAGTETSLLGSGGSDVDALTAGAAGAEMAPPAFATFDTDDDEEEEQAPPPKPAPAPAPSADDDMVSFDDDPAPPVQPTPASAVPDDEITLDLGEPEPTPSAPQPETPAADDQPKGALDEDLESLLMGTFPGAPDNAEATSPLQSATPGDGVEELHAPGSPEPAQSHVVFEQSFDNETPGTAPQGWSGEYEYASLTVERLDEAGHAQCVRFEKNDGSGSATYHLAFPKAQGRITAEFDIRCDQKNKFLLGVYLEKDEDFKQSVHTIVHQLDPNSPAALRIQGVAAPYQMGSWRRVRYEIDLASATLDGYLDDEPVVQGVALPNAPEYINTLSIRDNLATTGTLLIDNIRITEA